MAWRLVLRKAGQPAPVSLQAWSRVADQFRVQELVSCRSLHSSKPAGARKNPQAEQGKEQQAKTAKLMQRVIPEVPNCPKRTPEELADAAGRAKDYSRQCMRALRTLQNQQKERTRLRCAIYLPYCHLGSTWLLSRR